MIPVIVIRPQPGCGSTVAAARAMGLDARGCSLFEIRPLAWEAPAAGSFDALLIGSANALRHGGGALSEYAGKPVYAVGEKTAQAAREAGFEVVAAGDGRLQAVLDKVSPCHRRLLRLTGAKRVDLEPSAEISIVERAVYSSDPLPMPIPLAQLLQEPALVLLHSAEAARHFASSCEARAIDRSRITVAAIAPRVAEAAGHGWRSVRVATEPSDDALLALAMQMCEETDAPEVARQGLMQQQTETPGIAAMPRPARSGRKMLTVALLAFLLGAALVGWVSWRGYFIDWIPQKEEEATKLDANQEEAGLTGGGVAEASGDGMSKELAGVSSVEARLAMLEDRFSRLNLQANAASGNAARAESLLIAFAARRMIDRGEPLRYLADQLRLRFSNAQPRAVRTITDFAQRPVTIDELSARLDALAPQLAGGSTDESFWDSAMREISALFTVRRESSALLSPEARIERARVMLRAGKIPEAIDQIERLPGAQAAETWIADANRYADVQQALDLIETAAMLEPSRLQDAEGNRVDQPSPLATPTERPAR